MKLTLVEKDYDLVENLQKNSIFKAVLLDLDNQPELGCAALTEWLKHRAVCLKGDIMQF